LLPTPRPCSGLRSSGANRTEIMRALGSWPTPTAADARGGPGSSGRLGGQNLRTAAGGSLAPEFVEWMMGFPLGWTEVE
jgi:hypothetical protein